MIPEWKPRIPNWANLSIEDIQKMSRDECRGLIKDVLRFARDMVCEGPEKKLILKMGKLVMSLEDMQDKEFSKTFIEILETFSKLAVLKEAQSIRKEIEAAPIEIVEELGPDPWGIKIPEIPQQEAIPGYNPWQEDK